MSERKIIEFEVARNEAIDAFFAARPAIVRNKDNEFLVESGFRLAWERQQADIERLEQFIVLNTDVDYLNYTEQSLWQALHKKYNPENY